MASITTQQTPTTLLNAVNEMLRSVGQGPVSSLLTSDLNLAATQALSALNSSAIEVLERGWQMNTEVDYVIDPATDGSIVLPANTLKFKVVSPRGLDAVIRGGKLYDRVNHTYNIGVSVTVELVVGLDFESLAQAFRWLIFVIANRRFATGKVPTTASFQFTKIDEDAGWAAAERADAYTEDRTLTEANQHFHRRRGRYHGGDID